MEAKSSLGKEVVARRRPPRTLAECEAAQADLAEMVRFYLRDGLLPLAGLTDVIPLLSRETVLDLEESWLIVRAVRATQAIRETFLRADTYPRLTAHAHAIPDLGELNAKLNKYFTRDGKLREEASAELRAIRQKMQAKRNAIQKALNDERVLELIDARHPLLDERLAEARAEAFGEEPTGQKIIPISVRLDREHTALAISGPNAGGKTVALKTTGLLVAMAMSGLPVAAADGTTIPIVDDFHVLIGDDQSVLEHLSTFSAYLVRLRRVLERATDRSLVLLDELGSGTDPEEGSAIATAVIEHLLDTGALMIVTTHLSALKSFAVNDKRIVNASMEFDAATAPPTYRMIAGTPGRSRAIDVAEMIGLPRSIIDRARRHRRDRYGETDSLIAEPTEKMST